MGQTKQNKLDKDFVEGLAQNDIMEELCVYTPEYNPHKTQRKFYCDKKINYKLELLGLAMISHMENRSADCVSYLEELDKETDFDMANHDCHLSPNDGCEVCENSTRIKEFLIKAFNILKN